MNKKSIFLALALAGFALPSAFAQGTVSTQPLVRKVIVFVSQDVIEKLDLSPAQNEKFQALQNAYRADWDKSHPDVVAIRKALLAKSAAEQTGDSAQIATATKNFNDERARFQTRQIAFRKIQDKYMNDFFALLTPEQKQIYTAFTNASVPENAATVTPTENK